MSRISLAKHKWQVKVLWGAAFVGASFILLSAVYRAASFPLEKLVVLAVSLFVAILINRYQPTIAQTRIIFSPKHIFAFWGIVWLGTDGGVLLGACSSLTAFFFKNRADRHTGLYVVSVDIVSTFIAAVTFYLAQGFMPSSKGLMMQVGLQADEILAATLSMAAMHFLINASLGYLMQRIDGIGKIRPLMIDKFALPAAVYLISLVAAFVLYFTFVKFGIEFGLVIASVAMIGDLAYRIHRRLLAQKTREISEASRIHLATVEALATAIDARDQVGIGHVRRAQIYAIGIGEILDLSEPEINALRTAALLHDIGKLAVPDHILNKPGGLTQAEMEKTKIHASVGASILEKVGFAGPVVPTVKYHHERWDGGGYPEGLKGNNIPLTARILAVADAYDTLRGARPYRPAVSREEARSFLLTGSGNNFDPRIVSVFLNNLRTFELAIESQGLSYSNDPETSERPSKNSPEATSNHGYVEQIKRANREVFTLYELAREFGSSVNLHETLSLFTRRVGEFIPYDTCSVYILDEADDFAAAKHVDGKSGPAFKGRRIKIGEGPTGKVLETRAAIQNADPKLDFLSSQQEFVSEYISMISLPLVADGELVGAISLYSCEMVKYEEEHLRLLETISRIAAEAIRKSLQHFVTETYALTDPMTGLPNARSLQMQFEKEVARADRTGSSFQALMLDLDGFKLVNDTFGHKVGDQMLKAIGGVIREQLRDYDFLSRYAGDEFVALIPDTHTADVMDLCTRIESAITKFALPVNDDQLAMVGVSLGASSYPAHGKTFDEMIVAADRGMYAIKAQRKRSKPPEVMAAAGIIDPSAPDAAEDFSVHELSSDAFVVELDETHIVSSALN